MEQLFSGELAIGWLLLNIQKQPPEVFCRKGDLNISQNSHDGVSIWIKLQDLFMEQLRWLLGNIFYLKFFIHMYISPGSLVASRRNFRVESKIELNLLEGLWSNGLAVKTLDFHSRGPVFETTGWLQGRLSLSSSEVDKMSTRNIWELSGKK